MTTRRFFLKSVSFAASTSILPAQSGHPPSQEELKRKADFHAAGLREAMKRIHGGRWHIHLNHDAEVAMIVKSKQLYPTSE